jgi:transcription initiation factor IIE alpha subunit
MNLQVGKELFEESNTHSILEVCYEMLLTDGELSSHMSLKHNKQRADKN